MISVKASSRSSASVSRPSRNKRIPALRYGFAVLSHRTLNRYVIGCQSVSIVVFLFQDQADQIKDVRRDTSESERSACVFFPPRETCQRNTVLVRAGNEQLSHLGADSRLAGRQR